MALGDRRSDRPRPAAAADRRRRDFRRVPRWRDPAARRWLPIPRAWRLLLTIILGFGFIGWVVWFAGTTIAAQVEALRDVVAQQFSRLMAFVGTMGLMPRGSRPTLAAELLGSVGRLTSAVGTAIGAVASFIAMIVIGIFLAAEPRHLRPRDRLDAAVAPSRRLLSHRRACRVHLAPPAVRPVGRDGLRRGLRLGHTDARRRADGGAARAGDRVLAFIPNIGAITSGGF